MIIPLITNSFFRLVVTTASVEQDDERLLSRLILEQIAEKDQFYRNDSIVIWEANPNGDVLTMNLELFDPQNNNSIKAKRKFLRHKPGDKRNGTRKMSAPF